MPAVPGTYVLGDRDTVARTVAEAVELRFAGWRLKAAPKQRERHITRRHERNAEPAHTPAAAPQTARAEATADNDIPTLPPGSDEQPAPESSDS